MSALNMADSADACGQSRYQHIKGYLRIEFVSEDDQPVYFVSSVEERNTGTDIGVLRFFGRNNLMQSMSPAEAVCRAIDAPDSPLYGLPVRQVQYIPRSGLEDPNAAIRREGKRGNPFEDISAVRDGEFCDWSTMYSATPESGMEP